MWIVHGSGCTRTLYCCGYNRNSFSSQCYMHWEGPILYTCVKCLVITDFFVRSSFDVAIFSCLSIDIASPILMNITFWDVHYFVYYIGREAIYYPHKILLYRVMCVLKVGMVMSDTHKLMQTQSYLLWMQEPLEISTIGILKPKLPMLVKYEPRSLHA